jgi:hypothetical protein
LESRFTTANQVNDVRISLRSSITLIRQAMHVDMHVTAVDNSIKHLKIEA